MAQAMKGKPRVVRAAIMMFGTIVGAGIFALPYLVAQSGYLIGLFWMLVLAFAVAFVHVLFGEIVAATREDHRMVGYVGLYLGPGAKAIENVNSIIGLVGSCIVYLILSGLFMQQVLSPVMAVSPQFGSYVMAAFGLLAAIFGTRFLLGIDSCMAWAELAAFVLLTFKAFTGVHAGHLVTPIDFHKTLLPYGLVLFSFGGLSAVGDVHAMTAGDGKARRKAILWGSFLAAGVTMLFVTAVVGATGSATTTEAVAGLNARFGGGVPLLAAITGFLAIITTYVVFTEYFKGQLRKDYHWPEWLSVLVAVGLPLGLFLIGVRNFGRILELIGSVLAGIEGIFIVLMYRIVRKRFPTRTLKVPAWSLWLLTALYGAGAFYELVFRLFR